MRKEAKDCCTTDGDSPQAPTTTDMISSLDPRECEHSDSWLLRVILDVINANDCVLAMIPTRFSMKGANRGCCRSPTSGTNDTLVEFGWKIPRYRRRSLDEFERALALFGHYRNGDRLRTSNSRLHSLPTGLEVPRLHRRIRNEIRLGGLGLLSRVSTKIAANS